MKMEAENNEALKEKGWGVIRFWEHEIKKDSEACLLVVEKAMENKAKT